MEISPQVREQVEALCRQISVAHDLDADIRKELQGHLEDKLLAYLSGEERLTEDDAFILVREHFGDPAVLKSLFQDVHVYGYHIGLARRLLAAFAATSGVLILQSAAFLLMTLGLILWADSYGLSESVRAFIAVVMVSTMLGGVLLMGCVLYRWHRRIEQGERPWFIRWPLPGVAGLAIILAAVQRVIPLAHAGPLLSFSAYTTATWIAYIYFAACAGIAMVVSCLVWIWWCDRPPRAARAVLYAVAAWLTVQMLGFLIPPPQLAICITESGLPLKNLLPYVNIAQGPLDDNLLTWYLLWEVPSSIRLYAGAQILIMWVFAGYLSRVLYRLAPRLRPMLSRVRGQ